MRNSLIEEVEKLYLKNDVPAIEIGDSICVSLKIIEGTKERIQKYYGLVTAKGGTGIGKTITVRKISSGIGVERVFLVHSPLIVVIDIMATKAKGIRRAKLHYMRGKKGKKAKMQYEEVLKTK